MTIAYLERKKIMIDYSKIRQFEPKKTAATGSAALHVTKTANGIRLRFNSELAEKLGVYDSFIANKKTLQILRDDEMIYIGEQIVAGAPSYKVKGEGDRPIMYNAEIGNAILAMSGEELKKNKTRCFFGIVFEKMEDGSLVAVIDPKKFTN